MTRESILRICNNYGQVTCETGWKWNTKEQPLTDFDLWYVWDGAGEMNLNGELFPLSKGSCFLFRPGDRTSAHHHPDNPLTVTYIHFEADDPDVPSLDSYRDIRDTLLFETYLNRYVQTLINESYQHEREAELLLSLLLQQLRREQWETKNESGFLGDEKRNRIHEAANFIRQNPGMRHSLKDLAERAGLSPRYFSLKFKETMSTTVELFTIRERIRRAEHLLRFNNMTVAEVADTLGYRNVYFFSRQFKQFTGRSPRQFAKAAAELES
ncbi:AraC family transcriptional regulator [Paenibacillus sp. HB172176]|uniref:AraC family transcriptional regulator n=1 Tax=Paenibacillus sp. HB172176 TaxID=2493690 RepID=UPI00143950B8|nr:AraC family transcriptional regulator [Paenibacillus sp. HB172176]